MQHKRIFYALLASELQTTVHIVANAIADSSQHKRHLRVIVLLATIFALLWVYAQMLDNHLQWDSTLLRWVQGHHHWAIDQVMLAITMSADLPMSLALISLAGIVSLIRQHWWLCVYTGCVFFSTTLSVTIAKVLVQRSRPALSESALQLMSFPSGHAARAVIVLGILALLVSRGRSARVASMLVMAAILMSCLVAVSRVYLGAHWPSDVLAGVVLASIFLVSFHWQLQRFDEPSNTLAVGTVLASTVMAHVVYWWLFSERQSQLYGLGIS